MIIAGAESGSKFGNDQSCSIHSCGFCLSQNKKS